MQKLLFALIVACAIPAGAFANPVLESYRSAAKAESPGFKDFSLQRGEALYRDKNAGVNCASCHGASPKEHGKHSSTGKDILPMATSANPERFTDPAKVEKWFKRNCNDVLKRPCTATEKGDFITYLTAFK